MFRKISQSSLTEKERDVAQMKNDLSYDFGSTPSFQSVQINGVNQNVHIISTIRYNERRILSDSNNNFNIGDLVDWDNTKWLISEIDVDDYVQTKGTMLKCIGNLLFYKPNINHTPIQIPYVVFDNIALTRMGIDENRYLTDVNSRMMILVSDNEITRQIQRNDIYKLYDQDGVIDHYRIIDINRVRKPGLIIFELDYIAQSQPLPSYSIQILNGNSISLQPSETLQLQIQVRDNDTIINPTPPLLYSSSDEDILTVSETGLITAIAEGNAEVVVQLQSDTSVSSTLNVTVEAIIQDNYTVDVFGGNEVFLGYTITLQAKIYNNGLEDLTKGVNWNISNNDGSSLTYLSIVSQTANSITLQASSNSNYKNKFVTVTGTFTEDSNVFDTQQVKLISLF